MRSRIGITLVLLAAAGITGGLLWRGGGSKDKVESHVRRKVTKHRSIEVLKNNKLHIVHVDAENEKVACRSCHNFSASELVPKLDDVCLDCHEDASLTDHDSNTRQQQQESLCLTCHDFDTASADSALAASCQSCHEKKQKTFTAIVVHAEESCADCHNPHATSDFQRRSCADGECHKEQATLHGNPKRLDERKVCLECHGPHEFGKEALLGCAECHGKVQSEVPLVFRFAGHKECAECHVPHDFSKAGVKACTDGCHEGLAVLGADKSKEHGECQQCHRTPHDPLASLRNCKSCHTKIVDNMGHPPSKTKGDCGGCHRIHGTRRSVGTIGCATCHEKAASEATFHKNKVRCGSCHRQHQFAAKEGKQGCDGSDCHSKQVQSMRGESGHANCAKCHKPHRPTTEVPACDSCHQDQRRTAPKGHENCADCHGAKTHAMPVQAKTCAQCHDKQGHELHGKISGGCEQCHRAHGPEGRKTPPSCASAQCHAQASLAKGHEHKEHQKCADCHTSSHGRSKMGRAVCTDACHREERNHVVKSPNCIRCHAFKN